MRFLCYLGYSGYIVDHAGLKTGANWSTYINTNCYWSGFLLQFFFHYSPFSNKKKYFFFDLTFFPSFEKFENFRENTFFLLLKNGKSSSKNAE